MPWEAFVGTTTPLADSRPRRGAAHPRTGQMLDQLYSLSKRIKSFGGDLDPVAHGGTAYPPAAAAPLTSTAIEAVSVPADGPGPTQRPLRGRARPYAFMRVKSVPRDMPRSRAACVWLPPH
jgi:hypothetical protein